MKSFIIKQFLDKLQQLVTGERDKEEYCYYLLLFKKYQKYIMKKKNK